MSRIVYIMQGIPGSGKSTWISQQPWASSAVICSADRFFETAEGYKFDPSKLEEAHNACLQRFLHALQNGAAPIMVVDNTNLSPEEIAPYYTLARLYGCEVMVVKCCASVGKALARNIHGVSQASLGSMLARLGACVLPPFWKLKLVYASEF